MNGLPVFVDVGGFHINPANVTFAHVDRHDPTRSVIGFVGDQGMGHRIPCPLAEVLRLLEGGKP